jgi:hypothetical protein
MSKGTRSALPGKYLPALTLLLVLSGLLLTVIACENLTAGTAPTIGTVAEVAATTTTATPITIPATITETTAAEEPTPTPHTEDTAAATTITSSPIAMSPAMTMVHAGLWTRYEETDPHVIWAGEWTVSTGPERSGGSDRWSEDPSAMVTVNFSGTGIRLIGTKRNAGGQARVTLDGGAPVEVSFMHDGQLFGQTIWSSGTLTSGTHVLWIDSTGGQINLDAMDVIGTLVY